jgi:hypothetical protein
MFELLVVAVAAVAVVAVVVVEPSSEAVPFSLTLTCH